MKRPLFAASLFFLTGEIFARCINENKNIAFVIALVSILICLYGSKMMKEIKKFVILLLFLCELSGYILGYGFYSGENGKLAEEAAENGTVIGLTGTIISKTKTDSGFSFILKTYSGRYLIRTAIDNSGETDNNENQRNCSYGAIPGCEISVNGVLTRPRKASNPGGFDAFKYYKSQGIYFQMEKAEILKITDHKFSLRSNMYKIRLALEKTLERYYDEPYLSLLKAMLFGDKEELDTSYQLLFQKSGIAHILAISGLHVALLASALETLLNMVGVRHKFTALIIIIFLFCYGMLTGFSSATLRAVIMLSTRCVAQIIDRNADLLTSLSATFLIMTIISPESICSAGMIMSFIAVLAVFVSNEIYHVIFRKEHFYFLKEKYRKKFIEGIKTILISITINCLMIPVLIYNYYEIPLYAMLINIVVIPLLSFVVGLGMLSSIIGLTAILCTCATFKFMPVMALASLLDSAAKCMAHVVEEILHLYGILCSVSLKLPFSRINPGHTGKIEIFVYYLLVLILLLIFSNKNMVLQKRIIKKLHIPDHIKVNHSDRCHVLKLRKKYSSREMAKTETAVINNVNPMNIMNETASVNDIASMNKKHIWLKIHGVTKVYGRFQMLFICIAVMICMTAGFLVITEIENDVKTTVAFLDVGQGDGSIIHVSGSENFTVDGGSTSQEESGRYTLIPALKYYGMSRIDASFISHTDLDHISGILYALQNNELFGINIKNLVFAYGTEQNENMKMLIDAAERSGTKVEFMKAGDKTDRKNIKIKAMYPIGTEQEKTGNDYSLVLDVKIEFSAGETADILYSGDISSDAEKKLVKNQQKESNESLHENQCKKSNKNTDSNAAHELRILKVPHHGSRYSSCSEFLNWTAADIAVISVGEKNRYGHPAEVTLARINREHIKIYRTDKNGSMVITN